MQLLLVYTAAASHRCPLAAAQLTHMYTTAAELRHRMASAVLVAMLALLCQQSAYAHPDLPDTECNTCVLLASATVAATQTAAV